MKKKTIILSLVTVLILGVGTTAYAATSTSSGATTNLEQKVSLHVGVGKIVNFKAHEAFTNLLKEKGVTDDEITSTLKSGKTLYDLATEKGLTDDEIKAYILNEYTKSIDEAVANGSITADQATKAKTKLQEKSANWNFQNKWNGKMKGFTNMKHKGKDFFTALLKEKGVTDDEISSASSSGKSLYDLAKEKGITDDEIKAYVIAEGTKNIDEAVANGTITADQAAKAKTKLQEKSANWTFQNKGNKKVKGSLNTNPNEQINVNQQESTSAI